MAYIGKEPIVGNFQVCDAISVVNGQASYTMQVSSTNVVPESANHMLVSLNGILQKPNSSFTISGSTITFASNLQTGDSIDFIMLLGNVLDIGIPSDSSVTDAKTNFVSTSSGAGLQIKGDGTTDGTLQLNCSQNSHGIKLASPAHSAGQSYKLIFPTGNVTAGKVLKVDSVSGSGTTGVGQLSFDSAGGITHADGFRLSADANSGTSGIVSSNWERIDEASFGGIGTGLTESSGIFSFPSTGIYQIFFMGRIQQDSSDAVCNLAMAVTLNNSDYDEVTFVRMANPGKDEGGFSGTFMIDVTDTSNVKFYMKTSSFSSGTVLRGNTDSTNTAIFSVRLGDT